MSRQDRLKAALRDNLKRRKAQARGRAQTADDGTEPEGDVKLGPNRPPSAERDGQS